MSSYSLTHLEAIESCHNTPSSLPVVHTCQFTPLTHLSVFSLLPYTLETPEIYPDTHESIPLKHTPAIPVSLPLSAFITHLETPEIYRDTPGSFILNHTPATPVSLTLPALITHLETPEISPDTPGRFPFKHTPATPVSLPLPGRLCHTPENT